MNAIDIQVVRDTKIESFPTLAKIAEMLHSTDKEMQILGARIFEKELEGYWKTGIPPMTENYIMKSRFRVFVRRARRKRIERNLPPDIILEKLYKKYCV